MFLDCKAALVAEVNSLFELHVSRWSHSHLQATKINNMIYYIKIKHYFNYKNNAFFYFSLWTFSFWLSTLRFN